MRVFGKFVVSAAAMALASSLTLVSAQAVPSAGKMSLSSQVVKVAEEKKDTKKKPAAKKAKPKAKAKKGAKKVGPGSCGVMKYWDKKTKKCADATTKK
jgi:hypothetical protein